jgi:hypothetical protein
MAHALGEMYYLAGLMEERRQKREPKEQQKQEQGPQTVHTGLVFISPRVPKEFDTIVPSDTGKPVNTIVNAPSDTEGVWCVIT